VKGPLTLNGEKTPRRLLSFNIALGGHKPPRALRKEILGGKSPEKPWEK